MKEYGEVAANFRLLTDIRFKLLAFLPIAAGSATALLSAGGGRDGPAEVRALVLSVFGLLVTVALATYNDRNDQLYDTLVGRAASIEWQLGLSDGSFANRPTAWFAVRLPVVRRAWSINHRTPVAWIYSTSAALWLFSACAAAVQLVWGDDPVPRGVLTAAIVPAIVLPAVSVGWIRRQRKRRQDEMRVDAFTATRCVVGRRLADVAEDNDFLRICARLGGVRLKDARTRARFYSHLTDHERRRFMPEKPDDLIAAHFVALISDMPAEWIDDCARERRKLVSAKGDRMANDFRAMTVIDRPIEEVFPFLADGENDLTFSPRVLEIAKTTDGPPAVGTVYASTVKDAGMKTKRQFKLTEFDPPTRIRWAEISTNLVTAPEGGYDLEREGSATRVTIYNVLEGHGLGKLIAPLALRSARKGADDFAQAIKAAVEASGRESPSAEAPD